MLLMLPFIKPFLKYVSCAKYTKAKCRVDEEYLGKLLPLIMRMLKSRLTRNWQKAVAVGFSVRTEIWS